MAAVYVLLGVRVMDREPGLERIEAKHLLRIEDCAEQFKVRGGEIICEILNRVLKSAIGSNARKQLFRGVIVPAGIECEVQLAPIVFLRVIGKTEFNSTVSSIPEIQVTGGNIRDLRRHRIARNKIVRGRGWHVNKLLGT